MEILQLLKGSQFHPLTQKNDTKLFIHNIDITTKICSNKFIRNLIQPSNQPAANSYWNSLYGEINWRGAWLVGEKLLIHNKVKEISYKICHNLYPAKKTLERFKLNIDYNCDFCQTEPETIIHLFYQCSYSKNLWTHIQNLIHNKTGHRIGLQESHILFHFENPSIPHDLSLLLQTIIMLGKFHIHKTKWAKKKPNGKYFENELKQYFNTITTSSNNKAIKISDLFIKYLKFPDLI